MLGVMRLGVGIHTAKRASDPVPPSGGLLLDEIAATPVSSYALRLLRSSYSGPCIRVRRSGDNTLQAIGFDEDGNIDTAALLAFCGSGDGFVQTWYDQSGTANQTQDTAALQPQIVSAGVVLLLGRSPAILGLSGSVLRAGLSGVSGSNFSVFCVQRTEDANSAAFTGIFTIAGDPYTDANVISIKTHPDVGTHYLLPHSGFKSYTCDTGKHSVVSYVKDNAVASFVRVNGVEVARDTTANGLTLSDRTGVETIFYAGARCQELLYFNSAVSESDMLAIESDAAEYGVGDDVEGYALYTEYECVFDVRQSLLSTTGWDGITPVSVSLSVSNFVQGYPYGSAYGLLCDLPFGSEVIANTGNIEYARISGAGGTGGDGGGVSGGEATPPGSGELGGTPVYATPGVMVLVIGPLAARTGGAGGPGAPSTYVEDYNGGGPAWLGGSGGGGGAPNGNGGQGGNGDFNGFPGSSGGNGETGAQGGDTSDYSYPSLAGSTGGSIGSSPVPLVIGGGAVVNI